MTLPDVVLLAIIQGFAELLPVSSSAHVIMAEKLLGLDPTAPAMTFLLVMLHTGTMFAVIGYFWKVWRERYFASVAVFRQQAKLIIIATFATGVVGLVLLLVIERMVLRRHAHAQVEQLFGNPYLIASGLVAAGTLILLSSRKATADRPLTTRASAWVGAIQGLCLPFRGFSRSGATISTAMFLGVERMRAEEFSFALAVVLTPPVVLREAWRLVQADAAPDALAGRAFGMGLLGMLFSFVSGWLALRWLSRWLEHGRWHFFGYYCLVAAVLVLTLSFW
ncbi:MAG: Undecaprenyl-diphosphatase [Rhodanobacteraceae bacterium]|nr:MAG: Undecaprenyl-diphosphatase [Rhodanobacteraceae bacterium]